MKIKSIKYPQNHNNSGLEEIAIEDIPEAVLLVGRNGSGKTRLIRLLEDSIKSYSKAMNPSTIVIERAEPFDDPEDLLSRIILIDESKGVKEDVLTVQLNEYNNCADILENVKLATEGVGYRAILTDRFIVAFIEIVGRFYLRENYLYEYRKQRMPQRVREATAARVLEAINKHLKLLVGGNIDYKYRDDAGVDDIESYDVLLDGQIFSIESLSPGQKVLLRYCIMFTLFELLEYKLVNESVIIIDEFGRGLHPYAEIELLGQLRNYIKSDGQLWIASHSPVVMAEFSAREIVVMENGKANYFNSDSLEKAIVELFGERDNASSLATLLTSTGNFAIIEFLRKCVSAPGVRSDSRSGDQQVAFIASAIGNCRHVLDYGAGYGRIYKGLSLEHSPIIEKLSYDAYEKNPYCSEYMSTKFPNISIYTNASEIPHGKYDVVILCSVLHEIRVDAWVEEFEQIRNLLNQNGKLIIIEQKQLSIGEKVDPYGYIVLSQNAGRILFDDDCYSDDNGISKLHAFAVPRDMINVDNIKVVKALKCIARESKEVVDNLCGASAREGRKYAFYLQQHYNAISALKKLSPHWDSSSIVKCVEGPKYASDELALRVEPVLKDCCFVAVSQNASDSVWVQRMGRQDSQGYLQLEACGFKGAYAVYLACDELTKQSFVELQKRAMNQMPATIDDIPDGAVKLCDGIAI